MTVRDYIRDNSDAKSISWENQNQAADLFDLSLAETEEIILSLGILPKRYLRNQGSISVEEQLNLLQSRISLVGCGGLGGWVLESLVRLGIGTIRVIDGDRFEESNLNRQRFSSMTSIGKYKVDFAKAQLASINPVVKIEAVKAIFKPGNGVEILKGSSLVVDGLDTIQDRLQLAAVCEILQIPLVHGSIAGWYGQVCTQLPGENTIQKIYAKATKNRGIESDIGNLPFTAALVASIESAEVCKLLLKRGELLNGRMKLINLLNMDITEVQI